MKKTKEVTERTSTSQVQIFTLRLWPEMIGASQIEWRGKIQHVRSGQVHYFRGWQSLMDSLNDIVSRIDVSPPVQKAVSVGRPRRRSRTSHRR